MVAVYVVGGLSASAVAFPQDGSAITLGEEYTVSNFQDYYATITPTQSGKLIKAGMGGTDLHLYLNGTMLTDVSLGYGAHGQSYYINVEAGKTYDIKGDFVMNGGPVVFEMEATQGIKLESCDPEDGAKIGTNLNGTGSILVKFSTNVKVGGATLTAGGQTMTVPATIDINTPAVVQIDIKDALTALYANGAISTTGGDAIAIKVTGITNSDGSLLYNGDGTLELNYVSSAKLLDLVESHVMSQFLSYFPAGDPDGIATFTFDYDLSKASCELSCGNPEASYYSEKVPVIISGKTATVNFTGKLRDLTAEAPSSNDCVIIRIADILGTNGVGANGTESASAGSYSFVIPYKYIEPIDIASEFTPASGAYINDVDNIEIWFDNASAINYEGVEFTYDDNGETKSIVVAKDNLNVSVYNDEATIIVAVPADVKGKKNITVSLYKMTTNDGQLHEIKAEYNMFVVKLVSPIVNGGTYASTGNDDFVFDINTDFGYLRYDFYNEADAQGEPVWVYGTGINKDDNGQYTAYNGNYTIYSNYPAKMVVSAYGDEASYWQGSKALESYTLTFYGTTAPFAFSETTFTGITPAAGAVLNIDGASEIVFTATFDGFANVNAEKSGIYADQFAGNTPFAKVEPIYASQDDKVSINGLDYSNTWKLTLSTDALKGLNAVEVFIYATGEDGAVVEGNTGDKENSYTNISYGVYDPASFVDLIVEPESGSEVKELTEFTLSYEGKAVSIDWNYSGEAITLSTMGRELIHEFTTDEIKLEYPDETSTISTVKLILPEAITDPATYLLYVPEGYFTIGQEFDVNANKALYASYTIAVPAEKVELTLDPAAGDVKTLTRIELQAPGIEDAGVEDWDAVVEIKDAEGTVVYSTTSSDLYENSFDYNSFTFVGFYLEPNITTKGVYTLTIPEGMLNFSNGSLSAALEAVYNVEGEEVADLVRVNWDNNEAKYANPYANWSTEINGTVTSVPMTELMAEVETPDVPEPEQKVVTYNFSEFPAGDYAEETKVGDMTIYASESAKISIDGSNKTIEDVAYTQRLKFGGTASMKNGVPSRVIGFPVDGDCTIVVAATSSSGSEERTVNVYNAAGTVLQAIAAPAGSINVASVEYTGEAGEIFIGSAKSGSNIYFVRVEYPVAAATPAAIEYEPTGIWTAQLPADAKYVYFTDGASTELGSNKLFEVEDEKTYTPESQGVTGVEAVTVDADADAVYYNLQGVRVVNPAAGQVYIKVIGKKATKVQL